MFTSLRFRLWLTYLLVVGMVVCVAGIAVVVYLYRNPITDRLELQRLRVLSTFLVQRSQAFAVLAQGLEPVRLQEAAARADNLSSARVAIFDAQGLLLVDSRAESAAPLPAWSVLRDRDPRSVAAFRDEQGRQWLYVITPMPGGAMPGGASPAYYMLLASPRLRFTLATLLRDEFLTPFVRGVILALVLSLVMAFWIAHWITKPLQRMAGAARSMPAGNFEKIPLQGPGEVRSLARAFNEMGEKVYASQRSQRDFIANVSHDLKTPLTSIQGFAQAILDGTADDPEAAKQAAQVIYDEAGRMHSMVQELLELARLDAGVARFERTPMDLYQLLQGVVQKFAHQAIQAQVDLHLGEDVVGAEDTSLAMIGDADRLGQVFSNLVDNAIKYTPAGGRVTVDAHTSAGWAEVHVADSGPGIPTDELERIFERFYQTDKSRRGGSRRGVGLGLAIAREIVQAHGGSISARNADDIQGSQAGAVFVVCLPLARPDDETLVRRRL